MRRSARIRCRAEAALTVRTAIAAGKPQELVFVPIGTEFSRGIEHTDGVLIPRTIQGHRYAIICQLPGARRPLPDSWIRQGFFDQADTSATRLDDGNAIG